MRMYRLAVLGTVVALVGLVVISPATSAFAAPAPEPASETPIFHDMTCPPDIFPEEVKVDCGFVKVPENRAHPNGRMIKVAAAVMHAAASHPAADPIVFIDGGPSFGAIASYAVDFYFAGAAYAQDHDVVLVDTRGTGLSQPRLGCPEFDAASNASFYSKPFLGSDAIALFNRAIRACRDRLAGSGIDLAAYNSAESAKDLDVLRQALGYRQWNLLAYSADGVLGLTYMRLFPGGIRSAIIDSGMSTQTLFGLDYWRGISNELDAIFAGCAANQACDAQYPNIRHVFYEVVRRLQAHPVIISFPDFLPNPVSYRLTGAGFWTDTASQIFPGDAFASENIHALLAFVWRSAHGDLQAAERELFGTGPVDDHFDDFYALGKSMSYECHDLLNFITRADLVQAARDVPAMASRFLDPNYDMTDGAWDPFSPFGCRLWNVGVADAVQHRPVSSSIPTLVLAGEYDTGVTPYITRQVPKALSHSFFYEFPAGAHGQLASYNNASECARSIADLFLEHPRETPNSQCLASLPPFDFTPPSAPATSRVVGPGNLCVLHRAGTCHVPAPIFQASPSN